MAKSRRQVAKSSPSRGGVTGSYLTTPYNITYGYGDYNAGIVRGDDSDWFSPLNPTRPTAPPAVAGRQFDFAPGRNLSTIRRPDNPGIFGALRSFADTCDILRLVIETRKDQFARQKWKIAPREDNKTDQAADCKAMTAFFRRPDGIRSWADWSRVLLEDLLVVDAPTLFLERKKLGGKLVSLFPMDGTTIKPVIDNWGRLPRAYVEDGKQIIPSAYQQVLKGLPAVDYAAALQPGIKTVADLIYRPRNVRTTTPYGLSPVEQVFTTVNITLRRQLFLLNYYTEGNLPDAIIGCPAEWTPDQISNYARSWDDLYGGNLENRRKVKFGPSGIGKDFIQTKEPELSGEFDIWLSKLICYAFSIPPNTFSKVIANRASAETSKEVAEEEGLAPILEWAKGLIDDILEFEFNLPGLEFVWQEENATDEGQQETILTGYVSKGILTINEARDALGRDKLPDPAADKPMIITAAGYTPLDANTIEGKQANMAAFGTPDGSALPPPPTPTDNNGEPAKPGQGANDGGKPGQKKPGQTNPGKSLDPGDLEKRDVSDESRDDHGLWTASGAGSAAQEKEKAERRKAQARERAAASRARAKVRAKEAERAVDRANGASQRPDHVATQNPEEEHQDFRAAAGKIVKGAVLIAGGALIAGLTAGTGLAAIGTVAGYVGEAMLTDVAMTAGAHILDKLGFEPQHADALLAAFKEHILGKTAGAAGDIRAMNELKAKLPALFDDAADGLLDYLGEHAPGAPLSAHNAVAEAIEGEVEKFKEKLDALEQDHLTAKKLAKDAKRTLYVKRRLTNADDFIAWANENGFEKTLAASDIHVTIAYSKEPVDWSEAEDSFDSCLIPHSSEQLDGSRSVEPLGDKGAVVLRFQSVELRKRWHQFRHIGASWDFPDYKPHVTITYDGADVDLSQVEPYDGPLEFGPEEFAEVEENWQPKTAEKLAKDSGGLAPVPFDRKATRQARAAIASIMTETLAKVGAVAARTVRSKLKALGKASEPEDISDGLNLDGFADSVPYVGDELADVASDSVKRTYAQIGVDEDSELMNQVNEDAVGAAHARAAEMVGMRWLPDGTLAPSKNAKNTITDTTREMIRGIIANGLAENLSSDTIADNIEAATAFSPERAELIAHTEVGNINSMVSLDSAQTAADAGIELLKGWLTAGDDRVEDICLRNQAAGFIALDDDFPSGDAAPLAHPRCLPGSSIVFASEIRAAVKRWYEGNLVVIRTAGGKNLSCTPNHPILTPAGWVAAGLLDKGSHVISVLRVEQKLGVYNDYQNMPARIEEIARSFGCASGMASIKVPVAAEDFHGDGEGSDVAVIWSDGLLRDGADTALSKHIDHGKFVETGIEPLSHDGSGSLDLGFQRDDTSSRGLVRPGDLRVSGSGVHSGPFESFGFGPPSDIDTCFNQTSPDSMATDPELLGDDVLGHAARIESGDFINRKADTPLVAQDAMLSQNLIDPREAEAKAICNHLRRNAIFIEADAVVDVALRSFSGHVYNLETKDSLYIADGIVTHNCQCAIIYKAAAPTDEGTDE